tara:strand:+ start:22 stop:405 length:384 start_codon:yes stop_codon:yes gene_type:complete
MNSKLSKYQKSNIAQKVNIDNKYDVINELLSALNKNLKETLLSLDKQKAEKAKDTAKKAQNIAFALQNCLDVKNGGEIAQNLNYCYRHIRFATQNYLENDKSNLLTSAHFVSGELLSGWKGMNTSVA